MFMYFGLIIIRVNTPIGKYDVSSYFSLKLDEVRS